MARRRPVATSARSSASGSPSGTTRRSSWRIASDINLPHVWDIVESFFGRSDANGETLLQGLLGVGPLHAPRRRLIGFAARRAWSGSAWRSLLVHVRLLERALVPLLVASQTVPIIAIAPVIVVGLKAGWLSIAIVATYLTFFPVTIAAIRGLRSADPRAFELMRSYAARDRTVLLEAPPAGVGAVPVHRLQDRGDRVASSGRSSASCRRASADGLGGTLLNVDAVLLDPARAAVGGDRGRRRCSGSSASSLVVARRALVAPRLPSDRAAEPAR